MNIVYILLIMTVTYYKLKHASDETKQFYIGSTDNIERRISRHKSNYNTQKTQLKLYSYIKSNGGWDAWTFEILEQDEIGGYKFRRYKKEALLIRQHGAKLNTTRHVPSFDVEDYRYRRQICASCGEELDITKQVKVNYKDI